MKTLTIGTVIAVAAMVSAAPAAEANVASLERRSITDVYLCKGQNFGDCTNLVVNIGGGCYNFPGDYNDTVSSLKTGGPSTTCYFYTNGGCSGELFVTKDHNPTIPGNFNDKLSSIHC